jgi:hypothetical protein
MTRFNGNDQQRPALCTSSTRSGTPFTSSDTETSNLVAQTVAGSRPSQGSKAFWSQPMHHGASSR